MDRRGGNFPNGPTNNHSHWRHSDAGHRHGTFTSLYPENHHGHHAHGTCKSPYPRNQQNHHPHGFMSRPSVPVFATPSHHPPVRRQSSAASTISSSAMSTQSTSAPPSDVSMRSQGSSARSSVTMVSASASDASMISLNQNQGMEVNWSYVREANQLRCQGGRVSPANSDVSMTSTVRNFFEDDGEEMQIDY